MGQLGGRFGAALVSGITLFGAVVLTGAGSIAGAPAAAAATVSGTTTLVSTATDGSAGDDSARSPSMSADGRYVAFVSEASNLVAGDTNGLTDVFVRDTVAGTTKRASVLSDGSQAARGGNAASISGDGRFVAFYSDSPDLTPGRQTGNVSIFVHDMVSGTTQLASVDANGQVGVARGSTGYSCQDPALSGDGRFVAFHCGGVQFPGQPPFNLSAVFLKDLQTGALTLASVTSAGQPITDQALVSDHGLSADGRYVLFTSPATNVVPDTTQGYNQIYLRDVVAGTTSLVSASSNGLPANQDTSSQSHPVLSADGHYAVFDSGATNLVAQPVLGDTAFRRNLVEGTTEVMALDKDGKPDLTASAERISSDGRYVTWLSSNGRVVENGTRQVELYRRDMQSGTNTLMSVGADGQPARIDVFAGGDISDDGNVAAFQTGVDGVVPADSNGKSDVFQRRLAPATPPPVLSDDFNDNAMNPSIWTGFHYAGAGPTLTESNQRVEVTIPANPQGPLFGAGYNSLCLLRGDFDEQVDYSIPAGLSATGVRVGLKGSPAYAERVSDSQLGESYLVDNNGSVIDKTATSDTSGKLRLVRSGANLTAYRWSGGAWVAYSNSAVSTDDAGFGFTAWSEASVFGHQATTTTFDNFAVNTGTVVCPSFRDDFDDDVTNPVAWRTFGYDGTGPTVSEKNQRVEVSFPANPTGTVFGGGYASQCLLRGDFDEQIDYVLPAGQTNTGLRVGMYGGPVYAERISDRLFGEAYLVDNNGSVSIPSPTSDRSGKLRLVRTGATITAYRWSNGAWVAYSTSATSTADANFGFAAWSHVSLFTHQPGTVAFDNFIVSSGQVVCPTQADTTAPVVTGQPDRVPDSNGWYRQPVTVTWTVFDPDSPATTPPPTTVNRDGSGVVVTSEPSCDPSNNCATGTFVLSLDQTGPTLIGQAKTPPNPAGWYRDDVAIQWTCSDALSGIPVGGCPSDSPITAEGRGLSVSASVSDRVGNRTDATSVPVNIDRTAPVTSSDAPAGWVNHPVVVTLAPTDNLSGVVSTTYAIDGGPAQVGRSFTVSGDGDHVVTFLSTDAAGNAEAPQSVHVKIDGAAPTITHTVDPAANAAGWNNTPVTVTFWCADVVSGVASCTEPQSLDREGAGQVVTGLVTNVAGNSASDQAVVSIDRTAPVTSSDAPVGWMNHAVVVTLAPTDNLSGVVSTTYAIDGGPAQEGRSFTVSGDGDHTVTFLSTDAAGNAEAPQTVHVKIDGGAPTITHTVDPAANAAGWNNTPVTVTFSCHDAQSPVTCMPPQTLSSETAGQLVTGYATDSAGNTVSDQVLVKIDKTAPVVTYSGNTTYSVDQTVNITCSATDALSGIASSTCANVTGPAWTFPIGVTPLSAQATDNAGNVGPLVKSSFTVVVDGQSLDALIIRWTTGGDQNGLLTKADAVAAAHNDSSQAGKIGAFDNQVASALKHGALTQTQADALMRLVRQL